MTRTAVLGTLLLLVSGLVLLYGCASTKQKVQDFVACLEVGMSLDHVKDACVPRLEKHAFYLEGNLTSQKDISVACQTPSVLCRPTNLSQLLQPSYAPPFTKEQPGILEPNQMVVVDAIAIIGSFPHVNIFYNKATNRVIGWVAYGL
jgi:hypothetical protein